MWHAEYLEENRVYAAIQTSLVVSLDVVFV